MKTVTAHIPKDEHFAGAGDSVRLALIWEEIGKLRAEVEQLKAIVQSLRALLNT